MRDGFVGVQIMPNENTSGAQSAAQKSTQDRELDSNSMNASNNPSSSSALNVETNINHLELRFFLEHFSEKAHDFDRETFVHLYEDTSEETVIKILAHFSENLLESIKNIEVSRAEENCEIAWKLTHKLAGSAELLGFKNFGQYSRELSHLIRANPVYENHRQAIEDYLNTLQSLSDSIRSTFPSLRSYL